MRQLERVYSAALMVILVSAAGVPAMAADGAGFGRLGAFRTQLGEASQGLSFSLAQRLQYESNLVRTSSDLETLLLYNTVDTEDFLSQTSVNAVYNRDGKNSSLTVGADVGYAKYFEFDQFSGAVAGVDARANWQFSTRCATGVSAGLTRRLASFDDLKSSDANFQTQFDGDAEVGCFVLDRVRLSGGLFGHSVRNEESVFDFADTDWTGYRLMVALVSAKRNEIGLRFESATTSRPNDPTADDIDNDRIEAYVLYKLGNRIQAEATLGNETVSRATATDSERATASADLRYAPTSRISMRVGYTRATVDAYDLVGTTRETDSYRGDLNWRLATRISAGVYASQSDDTLNSGTGSILTGVNETNFNTGAYLEHTLFNLASLRWNLGYVERESDLLARDFDSVQGGVTLGIGF